MLLLVTLAADATPRDPSTSGDLILKAARAHLGERFAGDCSSFVRQVYSEAGFPIGISGRAFSRSEAVFRALRPVNEPAPGDLAFFHDTYPANRGGKRGARFTHVGIVEALDGAEVTIIHRAGAGIERLQMDLSRRHDPHANGVLRRRRPGDDPRLLHLSGELFTAYAAHPDVVPWAHPLQAAPRHPNVAIEP